MTVRKSNVEEYLPHHWKDHYSSVRAILKDKAIPVLSYGTQFVNINFWPLRILSNLLCKWAAKNPGLTPTHTQIGEWVKETNKMVHLKGEARIVLPAAPGKITKQQLTAFIGGAYHEAAHSLYTENDPISVNDVSDIILSRWNLVENWSPYANLLLEMANIIEDIRIERLLIAEFPGTQEKMWDLQDFILSKEQESFNQKLKTDPNWKLGILGVAKYAFRDAGLGYGTNSQHQRFDWYKEIQPDIMEMLLKGPLWPLLKSSVPDVSDAEIETSKEDRSASFRLALDFVGVVDALVQHYKITIPEHPPCTSCGASPRNLVVYAHPTKKGWVRKRCLQCNHTDEMEIPEVPDLPDHIMLDVDTEGEQPMQIGGPGGGGSGDVNGPENSSGTGSTSESKDESEGGGESVSGPGGGGKSGEGGSKTGQGQGHLDSEGTREGVNFEQLAAEMLSDLVEDSNPAIKDHAAFGEELFEEERKREEARAGHGERPYLPHYTDKDTVSMVEPGDIASDTRNADILLRSVREECVFLRARLRNMFQAMSHRGVQHGVRKGRRLSGRMLVDTVASLRGGREPKRAFMRVDRQADLSISAAIVIDESGSMYSILTEASKILISLTEPLDQIGAKVMVTGIRDSTDYSHYNQDRGVPSAMAHRTSPVHHDVFKTFEEKFNAVRWRFARTTAGGSTPLADGVQFALNGLMPRREAYRFLFVVTDGEPNHPHAEVIARQCRLAKSAGIHVIGVGIGADSRYVKNVFPDHVFALNVPDLPKMLVKKLNTLIEGGRSNSFSMAQSSL